MTHKINFLKPLKGNATKTFARDAETGVWIIHAGYQAGKYFDGYSYEVEDIEGAFEILKKYQDHPRFMIQGDFLPGIPLRNIPRRKLDRGDGLPITITDRLLKLICFDVDGYQTDLTGQDAVEMFISELPGAFWEADYIYQYSSSYGLFAGVGLKVHLFFWLEYPASNVTIGEWANSYNKEKNWGDIIDSDVFTSNQPVYTQRRICLNASDPVKDFIGLVKKSGKLEWTPPEIKIPERSKRTRKHGEPYSLQDGIEKILTGKSFHDEINKLALSLMGRGMPANEIKDTIKGMMLAAKSNITASKRLQDWKIRFNDIDRSVDSAFDLVDNPAQEDLIAWLKAAPKERVLKEFPGKCLQRTSSELKEIIETVSQRTGMDKRKLKRRVKDFSEDAESQAAKQGRLEKMKDRKKRKIYEVVVNKHNYMAASDQVSRILAASERWPFVFVYGGLLSYIHYERLITIRQMANRFQSKKRGERFCRTPVVMPFRHPYHDLIARLGIDIRFTPKKLGTEIECPNKLASVVALGNDFGHRELTGIIQCPFVTADWQIYDRQGYDPETGLYSMLDVQIERQLWPPDLAVKFLRDEVLAEFPFATELDGVVMIAAMLALMQRPLLAQDVDGMPGFGITAPVQSSGKTTLVNFAMSAVLNNIIPSSAFSNDLEEFRKYMLTVLMAAQPCVFFDNLPQGTELKSALLSKIMTGDTHKDRTLGVNKEIMVATSVIMFFTGNNIGFPGDFSTRIFPINLNPKMENPDTRQFQRRNVIDWAYQERPRILTAMISLLMAGRDAQPLETGSRFKIWDRYIRDPLHAVTGIDINAAILGNKAGDKDFANKKALMKELYKVFDDAVFVSRNLITKGWPNGTDSTPTLLGELLEDILGKYKDSAKSIGKLLSRMLSRTYGNMSLTKVETDRAYWQIENRGG